MGDFSLRRRTPRPLSAPFPLQAGELLTIWSIVLRLLGAHLAAGVSWTSKPTGDIAGPFHHLCTSISAAVASQAEQLFFIREQRSQLRGQPREHDADYDAGFATPATASLRSSGGIYGCRCKCTGTLADPSYCPCEPLHLRRVPGTRRQE